MKIYDNEQLKAINANGGYYLVLAPPGCGKTDILSERIVRAKQQGVGFEDMLCLTFTNRTGDIVPANLLLALLDFIHCYLKLMFYRYL